MRCSKLKLDVSHAIKERVFLEIPSKLFGLQVFILINNLI